MGYIRHHTIVCTSSSAVSIEKARDKAKEIFGVEQVTNFVASKINGYTTFFVGPDGSKEGWQTSAAGNEQRAEFIQYLKLQDSGVSWAELYYGDDNGTSEVTQHN